MTQLPSNLLQGLISLAKQSGPAMQGAPGLAVSAVAGQLGQQAGQGAFAELLLPAAVTDTPLQDAPVAGPEMANTVMSDASLRAPSGPKGVQVMPVALPRLPGVLGDGVGEDGVGEDAGDVGRTQDDTALPDDVPQMAESSPAGVSDAMVTPAVQKLQADQGIPAQRRTMVRAGNAERGDQVAAAARLAVTSSRAVDSKASVQPPNLVGGQMLKGVAVGTQEKPVSNSTPARTPELRVRPAGRADVTVTAANNTSALRETANAGGVKVTVMHVETHIGTSRAPSFLMSQDFAETPLQRADLRPGSRYDVLTRPTAAPSSTPAKTMQLQLDPGSLGSVVVKMHLKGQGMVVHIQPQLAETAILLRNDSATLNLILQAAGPLPDPVTVQISDPAQPSSENQFNAQEQGARNSETMQRGDPRSDKNGVAASSKEPQDAGPEPGHDAPDAGAAAAGGRELYL
ncbi:MAG: flagellar hook-length control protein FliK [Aestuariivirgaceae bacterium]